MNFTVFWDILGYGWAGLACSLLTHFGRDLGFGFGVVMQEMRG